VLRSVGTLLEAVEEIEDLSSSPQRASPSSATSTAAGRV
jgi:hypothetical protein